MARKKRTQTRTPLPLSKGEVWEVGRRMLAVHIEELAQRGEQPEILLAVQAGEAGGVVHGEAITSSAPPTALAEFVLQAIHQPLLGHPRRPEVIRVSSPAEAELLAVPLAPLGVALEVAAQLASLDAVHTHMGQTLGGLTNDYCTQATQAGETLRKADLLAFFRVARTFFSAALWQIYGDEVIFEIALEPAQGPAKTLYGTLMGSMGQEFGLALFHAFDDFQRFYDLSIQHLDITADLPWEDETTHNSPEQLHRSAELMAQLLQVPAISLTYTPQDEVPPPLLQEARHLKLPLRRADAFPLVMRTGQHGLQVATATDLAAMFSALQAILGWHTRRPQADSEAELDTTFTATLPAVEGFVPELTAHTTLRANPCLPESAEDEDDEDALLSELGDLFNALLAEPSDRRPASKGKQKSGKKASRQRPTATDTPAPPPTASPHGVYTLDVYLVGGPMTEEYAAREISRRIDMRGRQTLHDLHKAIFGAFERWEEHLYEFNLGVTPEDRSHIYFYSGGWDAEEETGDPTTTALAALDLQVGRRFGYTFDMGDQWEHIIEVVAVSEKAGKGKYPRVVKKVGTAPPQYPEDDEEL
jgi:hypothetical protein